MGTTLCYLVTGGAGFIGTNLVERLLRHPDHRVLVLDNFSTGRRESLAPWLDGQAPGHERLTLLEGDLRDPDVCRRACVEADFILHQAALGSVPRSVEDPLTTHEVNVTGTLNLLQAARPAQRVRRFVLASSSSVYGDSPTLPKHERLCPEPRSPYAVSKLAAERYALAFHAAYGLPTVALRYSNVFGPRQRPDAAYAAVIPRFLQAALDHEPLVIYGDGSQTRDFTPVAVVVEANLRACASGPERVAGHVLNVGLGGETSLLDLVRLVKRAVGSLKDLEVRFEPERPGDVRHSRLSGEKLARALGPGLTGQSVEAGLALAAAWLRAEREGRLWFTPEERR